MTNKECIRCVEWIQISPYKFMCDICEKIFRTDTYQKQDRQYDDTIERDGRLYYKYVVNRTKQLASAIIQNKFDEIGRIKEEIREVNLNGDDKRFWLGRLVDINDGKMNNSMSLNLEFFAERFELNDTTYLK